jgi:type IV pilus assembly protein PilQ
MLHTFAVLTLLASAPTAAAAPVDLRRETRISVDLKDTSVEDLARLLGEVAGLQVVMDPGTHCTLTLKLKEVPWPKVLDMALKSCGLAQEDDGGITRIAPASKLLQESGERRKLAEEQKLSGPLRTTRYPLSYAKAEQLAPIVKKFLSPRGEVVVDSRTNTLIITDVD